MCPRRKFSWLNSPAEMGRCSATRRISLRSAGGKSKEVWPSNLALSCGGAPEMRASATSMPSAEVPDIRPRTRSGFAVIARRVLTQATRRTQWRRRTGFQLEASLKLLPPAFCLPLQPDGGCHLFQSAWEISQIQSRRFQRDGLATGKLSNGICELFGRSLNTGFHSEPFSSFLD